MFVLNIICVQTLTSLKHFFWGGGGSNFKRDVLFDTSKFLFFFARNYLKLVIIKIYSIS